MLGEAGSFGFSECFSVETRWDWDCGEDAVISSPSSSNIPSSLSSLLLLACTRGCCCCLSCCTCEGAVEDSIQSCPVGEMGDCDSKCSNVGIVSGDTVVVAQSVPIDGTAV